MRTALLIGLVVATACSKSNTTPDALADAPHTATTGTVERGHYLVDHVFVCGVCHTRTVPTANRILPSTSRVAARMISRTSTAR